MRATLVVALGCGGRADVVPGFPLTSAVLSELSDVRPFVLRLFDGETYRDCTPRDTLSIISAATCAPIPGDVLRRIGIRAPVISEAARATHSTDAIWALTLLDLVATPVDPRKLDRVIGVLREVRAREPALALVGNHLAIAHALRANARDDARDVFAALDEVERTALRDSASASLRYNRARLHALVGTSRRAREEWTRVITVERDGEWRADAEAQLAALPPLSTSPFVEVTPAAIAHDPQGAREFALDSLRARWARAKIAGDETNASRAAHQLQTVATELLRLHGDSSVMNVAREISDGTVADAVLRSVQGIEAYRRTQYDSTIMLLEPAVQSLVGVDANANADWGALMLGAAYLAQRRYDLSLQTLEASAERAERRHDLALRARVVWATGIVLGRSGRMDDAERRFAEAHQIFASLGEWRNAGLMTVALSDVQHFLGRSLEAAHSALRGLTSITRHGALNREEDLLVGADLLLNLGRPRAALHLLSEAALVSGQSTRAKDLPETLARMADVQRALGDGAGAVASVRTARPLLVQIGDSAMRSRIAAELDRSESRIVGDSAPARALRLIDAARMHFATNTLDDVPLLSERARMKLALGDSAAAEADLSGSIRRARAQARTATPAQARQLVAMLRASRRILIDVALARGDTVAAYAETVRLSTIGLDDEVTMRPISSAAAVASTELRFVVSPQSVLSWATSSGGRTVSRAALSRDSLASEITRFVNLLRLGDDTAATHAIGRELYSALIAPHASLLSTATTLDVHMDDVLFDLPVAALRDDEGRLLGERFSIRYIVAARTGRDSPRKLASSVPLLIGDPAWRRAEHPELEPLRRADAEVREVAALYPESVVLTGATATKAELIKQLPRHAVVHFAGHSRVVLERPETSHLVLAGGTSYSDGVLSAAEISQMDLRGVRLVVLSSCGRSRDDAASLGSVNALAVAFLDAGVERVVASQFEMEDELAKAFAVSQHRNPSAAPAKARSTYPRMKTNWWRSVYVEYAR